ncbi:MAG: DUF2384 domain-containing protein [Opitutales bacterium]|nr:DUF2384 domain-containing protein [Opitutales bacterium]
MKRKRKETRDGIRVEEPAVVYGFTEPAPPAHGDLETGEVLARIRRGLPMAEFETLREMLGISAEQLAAHLTMSRSTLARRRKVGRLDPLESDRLVRFARLFARAHEVFKDPTAARNWLRMPARALAFTTPMEFAETETGGREVEELLGRIEHGVFT